MFPPKPLDTLPLEVDAEGLDAFRFFLYSKSMEQPSKVANPDRGQLNREEKKNPVRVRAWEFGLARQVRQSRPASACSSPNSG